jgi:lipoate-protein ligase A
VDPPALDVGAYTRDDDLIAAVRADGQPHLRVYPAPRPEVVLGRGGKARRELIEAQVRAEGLPVSRRRGGGGAVVLDPGNVIVSLALPSPGVGGIRDAFDRLTGWVIDGLRRAGVPDVTQGGTSDLVLADRKVGGSCLYQGPGVLFYSTTLLQDPDVERMERILAHPPREPDYRRGRSHRDFVGRLRGFARSAPDLAGRLSEILRIPQVQVSVPSTGGAGTDPWRTTTGERKWIHSPV